MERELSLLLTYWFGGCGRGFLLDSSAGLKVLAGALVVASRNELKLRDAAIWRLFDGIWF